MKQLLIDKIKVLINANMISIKEMRLKPANKPNVPPKVDNFWKNVVLMSFFDNVNVFRIEFEIHKCKFFD